MSTCLDAETIAAWLDGSLAGAERAAAEAHAADCDRCLAVLAAVAKTAPPAQERVRPSWLSVRWLVPVATVMVAAVAWMLVQNPREPLQEVATVAVPAQEALPRAAAPAEPGREADAQANRGAVERKAEPSAVEERRQQDLLARSDAAARLRDEAARRERIDRIGEVGVATAPPSPPAPPPAAAAAPESPAAVRSPAAGARAMAETIVQQQFRSAETSALILSPDPNVRWRISGSSIARSTDAGLTWNLQSTGTQVPLSSGAAPAPEVCWIVGRAGTVLLTTNGETWRRLDFVDPKADLLAVTARDALTATVTTADGRAYRTGDGGKTWTLQENPPAPF
jgi:hypothetical protein